MVSTQVVSFTQATFYRDVMKKYIITLWILVLAMASSQAATKEDFQDQLKRHGYALGANYGRLLKQNGVEVDLDLFLAGMKDYLAGASLMEDTEIATATKEINQMVADRRKAEQELAATENLEKGKAFLEENKTKEGIKSLASGLQYKIINEGSGAVPTASDKVSVHYRGTFMDGKEFDSSYSRGKPASFNVTGVIRGWTEALQLMPVGSKWELFIPSDLAYGKNGNRNIPPNSTLVFEVELLGIESTVKTSPSQPITSDIIKVPSAEELKKGAQPEVIKKDEVDAYLRKNKPSQPVEKK
jgi:FKBP-type peptidyl-prolyl cis-trans isomerase